MRFAKEVNRIFFTSDMVILPHAFVRRDLQL